jgi:hypothetical protein
LSESKKAAVKQLNDCYAIIKKLSTADPSTTLRAGRETWGRLYAWINRQVKQQDPLDLILACLRECEKEFEKGHKPDEFWSYMGGIRRRIERERWTAKLRRGDATMADLLEPVMKGFGGKKNA